jgi:hypothetical protein
MPFEIAFIAEIQRADPLEQFHKPDGIKELDPR